MKLRLPWRTPTPADLAARLGTVRPLTPVLVQPAPGHRLRATYRVDFEGIVPELTVHQATRTELAAQIRTHYTSHTGLGVLATVDRTRPGGLIRAHDRTVGAFSLTVLPTEGGASNA